MPLTRNQAMQELGARGAVYRPAKSAMGRYVYWLPASKTYALLKDAPGGYDLTYHRTCPCTSSS